MDWINVLVGAVCSIVGAFGGSSVIYFRQTKRLKAAEAAKAEVEARNYIENSEIERWRGLADRSENQLTEARKHILLKNEQVDKLYKRLHELEADLRLITNKYNSAMLFIDRIRGFYCTNKPCPIGKRIPSELVSIEQLEKDLMKAGLILPVSISDTDIPPEGT